MSDGTGERLHVCHACEFRRRHCGGPCDCTIDGRDIIHHAGLGYCPDPAGPRFGAGTAPDGWDAVPLVTITVRTEQAASRPPPATAPVPREQWPLRIKTLALLAAPDDKGVGDTAHRVLAHVGGDALAALWEEATGRPCGCPDRQAALNAAYPYGPHC